MRSCWRPSQAGCLEMIEKPVEDEKRLVEDEKLVEDEPQIELNVKISSLIQY